MRRTSTRHVSFDEEGRGDPVSDSFARSDLTVADDLGNGPHDDGPSEIRFSHLVPENGDSWPYIRRDSASTSRHSVGPLQRVQVDDNREHVMLKRLLEVKCLDPVQAGVLTQRGAAELFAL